VIYAGPAGPCAAGGHRHLGGRHQAGRALAWDHLLSVGGVGDRLAAANALAADADVVLGAGTR
jgi:TPP-dependent trihydroxycyclohexane-1,2-dione (THcHDO) dehydratase